MVKKLLAFINRDSHHLGEAALMLGFFALLSQILGLLRDRGLAHVLGASKTLDIYTTAFRIPDFLYVSVAALVSVTILVPFLVERFAEGEQRVHSLVNSIFTIFSIAMLVFIAALYIFMPKIAHLVGPGFDRESLKMLVTLSRVMLVSPFLLGLSNFFGSIIQFKQLFFSYAIAPVLYNFGIIFGIFVLYPHYGPIGLALGVISGALLHFAIQIPSLSATGFAPRLTSTIDWQSVRQVVAISLPRTLTLVMVNVTVLISFALTTKLEVGAVSLFYFALNIATVPLSVVGVSFSVASFPTLVRLYQAGDREGFRHYLATSIKQILFWVLPATALFMIIRAQIIRVLLGTNAFSWNDTKVTAALLLVLVVSAVAQCLIPLIIRAFYARGDTRTPLFIVLAGSLATVFLTYAVIVNPNNVPGKDFLVTLLRLDGAHSIHVVLVGLAYSIGNFIMLGLLYGAFVTKTGLHLSRLLIGSAKEIVTASTLIGVFSYAGLSFFNQFFDQHHFLGVLGQGTLAGVVGITAGCFYLSWVKNVEYHILVQGLKQKLWKKDVVIPEQRDI